MKTLLVFLIIFLGSALAQTNYYKSWFDSLNLSSPSSKNPSKSSASALQRKNLEVNNVPNFPKANLTKDALNSLNLAQISDLNSSNILKAAIKQTSSPVKSFQSVFARFPSKEEIKQISEDGDVGAITKTLQVVSFDTQVPCNIKIPYLMDLLGTVKDNVKVKTAQSDYQSVIIDSAKNEIQIIQSQIDQKQKQKEDLNLKILDAKVVDLSSRFYTFSNQIKSLNNNIAPEQARIAGFENQLNIIENQSQYQRDYMSINKITLVDVENLIRDLENKLEEAKISRATLQERINSSQNTLQNNQYKKDKIRQSINETSKKIQIMRDQGDELKRQSYHLEVDLERARTDLSVQKVKQEKLTYQIERLNNKKSKEQSKINEDNLLNLKSIIKNSKTIIPSISNELNRQYYYCYGDGKFTIQDVGSTRVYTINFDNFANYIQAAYGKKLNPQQLRTNNDIQLKIIDLNFQIPNFKFGSDVSLQNLFNTNQGFMCMSRETLTSDVGKILGIQPNGLIVQGVNGRNIRLAFGGCTRIQSTSQLLSIGQNIAWKGIITSVGKFNLFAATCWS